mmetsp:Transcript_7047/g.6188  ORF Transcript_7047/g.6188 Transcript_7047/m.6188 type:complete len:89 (-) Transcript_7047:74-340(-)
MEEENMRFQAFDRLARKPIWSWEIDSEEEVNEATKGKKIVKDPYDAQAIRILAVTWNLHGKTGPDDLELLLRTKEIHHDLYIIGTQES